ncbi:hypothetical protein WDZ92_52005, partial [Nostoc sp. NIES-2111]
RHPDLFPLVISFLDIRKAAVSLVRQRSRLNIAARDPPTMELLYLLFLLLPLLAVAVLLYRTMRRWLHGRANGKL